MNCWTNNDTMAIFNSKARAVKVAILDGVLYIPSNNRKIMDINTDNNIMSALVLKDFLYPSVVRNSGSRRPGIELP